MTCLHAWTHEQSEREDKRQREGSRDALHGTRARARTHTHTHTHTCAMDDRCTPNCTRFTYLLTMCLRTCSKGLTCMLFPSSEQMTAEHHRSTVAYNGPTSIGNTTGVAGVSGGYSGYPGVYGSTNGSYVRAEGAYNYGRCASVTLCLPSGL